MNIIKISKNNQIIDEFGSSFIPNEGEYLWYGENKSTYYKITDRVIDLEDNKLVITLIVE